MRFKYHIMAFKEPLEMAMIGGLSALLGDCLWLTHDVVVNGFSVTYLMVALGLWSGTIITIYATYLRHDDNVRWYSKDMLCTKLRIQRYRVRYYNNHPRRL